MSQPQVATDKADLAEPPTRGGVTWRSVAIALILAPLNCYWVVMMGEVRYSGHPTTVSLFFNVIFTILVIGALNSVIRWLRPRWALEWGELIVIYTMLSISSALAGHDGIQMLAPIVASPHWFATPENKWDDLFGRLIPPHWAVSDMDSLRALFEGGTTLYRPDHYLPWLAPVATWSAYIILMLLVMVYLDVLLRRQWTEHEKLSYPLVEVPLAVTQPGGVVFRNRLFWLGFSPAAAIDILNGLHVLYPRLPELHVRIKDMSKYFKSKPWSAVGWTPISFYPFAIGLGYLLPQDQLFSCWFFYFFWKAQRIISCIIGFEPVRWTQSAPPYLNEQSFGGYLGLFIFSLWAMRGQLRLVWRALRGQKVDDDDEPARYRTAATIVIICFALLVWFSNAGGISLPVAIAYMLVYFVLSVVITRIRAELGHPVHDLHFAGPDLMIPKFVGTKHLSKNDLLGLSFYFWQNRAHRNHPMPHQLEGMKMGRDHGVNQRNFLLAMIAASVIGALGSFWGWLHPAYSMGVGAKWTGAARHFGMQPFQRLQGWLLAPTGPSVAAIIATAVGTSFVVGLMVLRTRFVAWPLHPIGYAVSSGWSMNCLWLPLLIAWVLKGLVLRYGRPQSYRRAMPFFIGLVLGEFVVGSIWTIIGITLGIRTYGFWV